MTGSSLKGESRPPLGPLTWQRGHTAPCTTPGRVPPRTGDSGWLSEVTELHVGEQAQRRRCGPRALPPATRQSSAHSRDAPGSYHHRSDFPGLSVFLLAAMFQLGTFQPSCSAPARLLFQAFSPPPGLIPGAWGGANTGKSQYLQPPYQDSLHKSHHQLYFPVEKSEGKQLTNLQG